MDKEEKLAYLRFKLNGQWISYTVKFPSKNKRDIYMLTIVGKIPEHGGSTGNRITKKMLAEAGKEIADNMAKHYGWGKQ